jgi:hypothetical protein
MRIGFGLGCVIAVLWSSCSTAYAETEGVAFGIRNFSASTASCDNSLADLPNAIVNADGFMDGLVAIGYDQTPQEWTDSNVWGTSWDDGHAQSRTEEHGADWADAVFIETHGGHVCSAEYGSYYSHFTTGHRDVGPCTIRSHQHMKFGDGGANEEANVIVQYSCESAHYCVWQHGGYTNLQGGSFQMLLGFHGKGYDYDADMSDYVADTETESIGAHWRNVMYIEDIYPGIDQCPTAVVFGNSGSNRDNFFLHGGWNDFTTTGGTTSSTFYYLCECDPADGVPLPACN